MDKLKPQFLNKSVLRFSKISFLSGCLAILTACGGGGGSSNPFHPNSVVLKTSVSGLTSAGLVLQNKSADDLSITNDGVHHFNIPVTLNDGYAVTVKTQPDGQTCTTIDGVKSGVTITTDTLVKVVCSVNSYTIAGGVTGLSSNSQLELQNNGADSLKINADGNFSFATPVAHNSSYIVTVATQPTGQICTVSNNNGQGVVENIADVNVVCSTQKFNIAGTVTGLSPGSQVTLENNNADPVTITEDGQFNFTTPVAFNGNYSVTIATAPDGQVCTVMNSTGAGITQDVADVAVSCSTNHYNISGSVVGLISGNQVTLLNNDDDPVSVIEDGSFSFAIPVVYNSSYTVTVGTDPIGQLCTVSNGFGAGVNQDISDVLVSCATNYYSIAGTVTGLNPGNQLTLLNNDDDPVTVTENGSFNFSRPVVYNGSYVVMVTSGPVDQVCTASNNMGNGVTQNVNNIEVVCSTRSYTISGTVSGLNSNSQVTLQNNGADPLIVQANGQFIFASPVSYNGSYVVTIGTDPIGQVCTATNYAGNEVTQNVNNVSVVCSDRTYTISGTVTGLNSGNQVTLNNNGTDALTVTTDGPFTFDTSVAYSSNYAVTVGTNPSLQSCQVNNGSGSSVSENVTSVNVTCNASGTTHLTSFTQNEGSSYSGLTQGRKKSNVKAKQMMAGNAQETDDDNLYGTTLSGGIHGRGSAYSYSLKDGLKVLHSFEGNETNGDGKGGGLPYGGLTLGSDGNFYGTTVIGGRNDAGTVYKLTPQMDGTYTYTILSSLADLGGTTRPFPYAKLIEGSDGEFYGTTPYGGEHDKGTVFRVKRNGILSRLVSFGGAQGDGISPYGELVQGRDGNLYGATAFGGANGVGTVFKVLLSQRTYQTIYSFSLSAGGNKPYSGLVQGKGNDDNFYGTTGFGGIKNLGTIFKITPAGEATTLYSFNLEDGIIPNGGLAFGDDNKLYGTTTAGGTGAGTIFRITTRGDFKVLHTFDGGKKPLATLLKARDGNFYGTTFEGGTNNSGTIFKFGG